MIATIADEFTQLVFHVFAHVRLAGPGNLYDPRYVDWTATQLAATDIALVDHDADLLTRLWNADPRYDRLHRTCDLHASIASFLASAERPLSELGPDDVADPKLLASLRELDGAELLNATLALLAPGFVRAFADLDRPNTDAQVGVDACLQRLTNVCPGLADARVELVWALGLHGRALPGRILVGTPADWNGCQAARQAVLAAHEHTVAGVAQADHESNHGADYVADEWAALIILADHLRHAETSLRDAHRDWLASLDLTSVLDPAVVRGYLTRAEADALTHNPHERADRLRTLRQHGHPRRPK